MRRTVACLEWIGSFFVVIFLLFSCPKELTTELTSCYYHLCFQLIFFLLIWSIIFLRYYIDILEPIVLYTVIHILIFEITPIICLKMGKISFFGEYVWGGCIKGTYVSSLGYLFFVFSYFAKTRRDSNNFNQRNSASYNDIGDIKNREKCLLFNWGVWLFAFASNLVVIIGSGLNLSYIITGGQASIDVELGTKSGFGFLVMFSYAMIPSFLYICVYGKSKVLKIILFYLMFMSFYVRGFRFILVATILAPLVVYALKKNKRPGIILISSMFIGLALFSGYMQFARAAIRAGAGGSVDIHSVLNFDYISNMLIENFEIVKTYYAIVEHIPKDRFFLLGAEMIVYTIVLFVPRFIWPGKPQPPIYDVIASAVNTSSKDAGTSYPYLGEYYFEFGILGVCCMMIVWGRLLNKLKQKMYQREFHSIALYACIYPIILQLMIRGYTPTNFYMILAIVLPIVFSKRICNKN